MSVPHHPCSRTWLEIDLDALLYNVQQIHSLLPAHHSLIAAVKANAYGHGDRHIAKALQQNGVHFFAVSNLDEAISLRRFGIDGEILILGYTAPGDVSVLAEYDIIQTVYSLESAYAFSAACQKKEISIRVHLKLDTGMGRIGFVYDDPGLFAELYTAATLPGMNAEGIFTHLSSADMADAASKEYTQKQLALFSDTVSRLRNAGISLPMAHILNSAGILQRLSDDFEASRAGIILYGLYPSGETEKTVPLKPVMAWKAVISHIKKIPAGHSIGYGRHFTSKKDTLVATVPVGYADGYPRILSGKGHVLLHGVKCPILGNICMDQMMLDITAIPNARPGDVITVMGREGKTAVTAEDLAAQSHTINYEITCNPSRRVPRVYQKNEEIIAIENDAMICAEYIEP